MYWYFSRRSFKTQYIFKTFIHVFKTYYQDDFYYFSRRVQNIFKTHTVFFQDVFSRRWLFSRRTFHVNASWNYVLKIDLKRLEKWKYRLEKIFKTYFQDVVSRRSTFVFKTPWKSSWKCILKVYLEKNRLENTFMTSWRFLFMWCVTPPYGCCDWRDGRDGIPGA